MEENGQRPVVRDEDVRIQTTRAEGPGGQNVNRRNTAVQAFLDIPASSLPAPVKQRLLDRRDSRVTPEGVLVVKAGEFRSQARNIEAARARLEAVVRSAAATRRKRRPTRPKKSAVRARLNAKKQRGETKRLRRPPPTD